MFGLNVKGDKNGTYKGSSRTEFQRSYSSAVQQLLMCCCVSDKSTIGTVQNVLDGSLEFKALCSVTELRSSAVKIWMPAFCPNLLNISLSIYPKHFFLIIIFTTCYDRTPQQINRKSLSINQIHAGLKS